MATLIILCQQCPASNLLCPALGTLPVHHKPPPQHNLSLIQLPTSPMHRVIPYQPSVACGHILPHNTIQHLLFSYSMQPMAAQLTAANHGPCCTSRPQLLAVPIPLHGPTMQDPASARKHLKKSIKAMHASSHGPNLPKTHRSTLKFPPSCCPTQKPSLSCHIGLIISTLPWWPLPTQHKLHNTSSSLCSGNATTRLCTTTAYCSNGQCCSRKWPIFFAIWDIKDGFWHLVVHLMMPGTSVMSFQENQERNQ